MNGSLKDMKAYENESNSVSLIRFESL